MKVKVKELMEEAFFERFWIQDSRKIITMILRFIVDTMITILVGFFLRFTGEKNEHILKPWIDRIDRIDRIIIVFEDKITRKNRYCPYFDPLIVELCEPLWLTIYGYFRWDGKKLVRDFREIRHKLFVQKW